MIRLLAAVALAICSMPLHAEWTIRGSTVDYNGNLLAGMTVEIAFNNEGLQPIFSDRAKRTRTDAKGRFELTALDDVVSTCSIHLIVHSDRYFGELVDPEFTRTACDATTLCIVCSRRYTLSVRPILPKGLELADRRCLLAIATESPEPRLHLITWPADGKPLEFPVPVQTVDEVLFAADPANKDVPGEIDLYTSGWHCRGAAASVACGKPVDIEMHSFREPLIGNRFIRVRVPHNYLPLKVIGLNAEGEPLWCENNRRYWNVHIQNISDSDPERLKDARSMAIRPGRGVTKLAFWTSVGNLECAVDVNEATLTGWTNLEWTAAKMEFALKLPDSDGPGRLVVDFAQGPFFDTRELVSDDGVVRFSMPGCFGEVTVTVPYRWRKPADSPWRVNVRRGQSVTLPPAGLKEQSIHVRGPGRRLIGRALLPIRSTETPDGPWIWVRLDYESKANAFLHPERTYEVRVGDKWKSLTFAR